MSSVSRPALGSVAKLGDLYDSRRDKFCGISILQGCPPDSAIQTRDNPFCDTRYIHSDKYSEKCEKLDVKAELKLSVLCGLSPLEGSGRYLTDEKSSKRAVRCTLMHSIFTKVEELNIYNDALKDCIDPQALKQEATHVVVGISWGANLMVTAEDTSEENEDTMQVSGALQAHLNKVEFAITGKAEVDYGKGDAGKGKEFSLNIYADVLPEGDLPQDIEGALELMKKLPTLIQNSNDGKGKPLQYFLMPLDVFKSHFNIHVTADTAVKELTEDAVLRFVQLFDQITDAKQQLNDLYMDVVKHRFYPLKSTRKEMEGLKTEADISESRLRSQLAELLVEVRKDRVDAPELEKLRIEYEQDPHSAENILKQIGNRFTNISDKINTYQIFAKHGVIFVPNTVNSLDALLLEHADKDLYILFSDSKAKAEKELWSEHLNLFLSLIREHDPSKLSDQSGGSLRRQSAFLYVDLDIAPQLAPQGNRLSEIQHFKNGKSIALNLQEDYARDSGLCLVKSDAVVYFATKPNKRVPLELRCPASLHGHCEPDVQKWTCFKCKTDVEYGFDGYFYCSCGSGKADTYSYRCSSRKHGSTFQKFSSDETTLTELLGQLKPMKELNILILGETGVGKSTWINALVNYISYSSLEEAESQELRSVIPTSFTLTNDDFEEVLVKTGEDANEDCKAGNSATQYPKSYTFPRGDTLVRLIDTPGIGDVRGVAQDKENFKRILDHISFVDEIHGICILLKPNNARLTVIFQFCIKELLTHLHREASKNIVFCFTNARQTFYKPGDTLQPLKRLLQENKEFQKTAEKKNYAMYANLTQIVMDSVVKSESRWWIFENKYEKYQRANLHLTQIQAASFKIQLGIERCSNNLIPTQFISTPVLKEHLLKLSQQVNKKGYMLSILPSDIDAYIKLNIADCFIAPDHAYIMINVPVTKDFWKIKELVPISFRYQNQTCQLANPQNEILAVSKTGKVEIIDSSMSGLCDIVSDHLCLIPKFSKQTDACALHIFANATGDAVKKYCQFKCFDSTALLLYSIDSSTVAVTNAKTVDANCPSGKNRYFGGDIGALEITVGCNCTYIINNEEFDLGGSCVESVQQNSTSLLIPHFWHDQNLGTPNETTPLSFYGRSIQQKVDTLLETYKPDNSMIFSEEWHYRDIWLMVLSIINAGLIIGALIAAYWLYH